MTDKLAFEILLKEKGFTKKQIATNLGITEQGLDKKLKNESEFKASELYRLSYLLGISIDNPIFFKGMVN